MFGSIVPPSPPPPPPPPQQIFVNPTDVAISSMADENTHKQEFRIRDLSTRSVLLFPTRAQIIRDIKEITLAPGSNQIIIDGLAPTVDEHSIKVEGTGSATITDVTVDLLPNRELFEDIYPEEEEEDEDEESEDEPEEPAAMTTIVEKIRDFNLKLLAEQEKTNSAANRLQICDNLGKSVVSKPPPHGDLEKLLKAYNDERQKIYNDHEASTTTSEKLRDEIRKAEKEKSKLARELVKATEKQEKEKAKIREKKLRQRAEIQKEKLRIKMERESFWPKKVYRVTINLEPSSFTPGSSRRGSIDGDTIVNLATTTFHEPPTLGEKGMKAGEICLSLSYITYSASWSPRYDLALNTVKSTGLLDYGAELRNSTSETWRDAKVVLSTSQTNFSGLSETIPIMQPWHVRLLKGGRNNDSALMSSAELAAKRKEWSNNIDPTPQKPRWEVFGLDNTQQIQWQQQQAEQVAVKRSTRDQKVDMLMSSHTRAMPQAFGSLQPQTHGSSLFGASNAAAAPSGGGLFGSHVKSQSRKGHQQESLRYQSGHGQFMREEADTSDNEEFVQEDSTSEPAANSLSFEAGAWEESGMTTTYDVPGTKTLFPSNSSIKHKIAKVEFKNVIFSHIVIGKLRQVAFLKARLRNTSKITLLKGPLGLTLDGSFLGQASFPRCSAGESFSLPLGVDPSIQVSYPKPTVRRSQTGIFSKEDSNVFSRSVMVTNTKRSSGVELTVLDQVPVSEDERLKIEILNPRGLKVGGDGIRTGTDALSHTSVAQGPALTRTETKSSGKAKDVRASIYGSSSTGKEISNGNGGGWGTALATAKKGGEVVWNVKLNPGAAVRLNLEYEATFPGGEGVVGV
ncbi:hypothetical protein BGZ60DRAFT_402185 [Tricladium varicosporioides]|nr:hypothetical protein BGZ60DRAFT_402185 [Hymenoscyphus varicosporioides]